MSIASLVLLMGASEYAGASPLPNSLATALSTASAAGPVVALGVGSVQPTGGGASPQAGQTPDTIVVAYGYTTRLFGTVTAVGPLSIAVPGDPSTMDPVQSMSDGARLTLFVSLLDQDQWDLLRGPNGIGLGDLSTDAQVSLFRSFLRPGTMKSTVNYMPDEAVPIDQELRGVAEAAKDPVLTDDDVNNARLRLSLRPEILLPLAHGTVPPPGSISVAGVDFVDARVSDDPSTTNYLLDHTAANSAAPASVRSNEPDAGDLDLSADWAKAPVTPRPGESLGDLLQTVHSAGGPEIYANPQIEHRALTVAGTASPTTAGDILRALAFAAAGTYRKVGDLYALTFDNAGTAVDWVKLADATAAAEHRSIGQDGAGGSTRSTADLTGAFSPLVLTSDETSGMQGDSVDLPYGALTPAQQDYVQRSAAKLRAFLGPNALDSRTNIHIVLRPFLQATLPTLDGFAELDTDARLGELFPSMAVSTQKPSLSSSLAAFKRRAVILRAKSDDQIDNVVSSMVGLGLNELWIAGSNDLAAHAVASGKQHAVKVRAYVDVLDRPDAPADARDLTVTGGDHSGGSVYASVTAPQAKTHALAIVDGVSVVPGIDGVVFGSTTPPGYGAPSSAAPSVGVFEQELGYTAAAREAFLRLTHADPVDILPPSSVRFDAVLRAGRDAGVDDALYVEWARYRADAAASLLKAVEAEASRKLPNVPVLVQLRGGAAGNAWFADPATGAAGTSIVDVPFAAASNSSKLQEFVDASGAGGHSGIVLDLRQADDAAGILSNLAGS